MPSRTSSSDALLPLLALFALALLLPAQQEESKAKAPAVDTLAWQEFLQSAGGEWAVEWCPATGTPRAIYGSGLVLPDWRQNSLEEARRHAGQLLRDRSALLGLGTSEFREVIGGRMGRTWVLVYDQYFGGLPVLGGRADVRVHMRGRIAMFGSTALPIPANFVTVPQLSELAATQLAWQAIGKVPPAVSQPGMLRTPRLVIWGDVHAEQRSPVVLAWEIPISAVDANGQGPIGRSYIDAASGAVLSYASDKHECGIPGCTGHGDHGEGSRPSATAGGEDNTAPNLPAPSVGIVMGYTRTGPSATSPLANIPLAGVEVTIPFVGTLVTDSNGRFSINLPAAPSVTVRLDGIHSQLVAGANAPAVTHTLVSGATTTFQLLSNLATANEAAHTTTYHWTWRVNEWCRSILGNTAELNIADNILPTVNIAATCNAYYTNNTINFYNAGGSCFNTGSSSIVAHEWGHGLDDRYGGISQVNGLSEGWGDICSMYLLDFPLVGQGILMGSGLERDGNNTRQYPTGYDVHEQGESWMGFAWKLRDHLATTLANRAAAIAITNEIVVGSIVADAEDQHDAVMQVFVADDDDGNLTNGTPHSAEILWACNQHSLPYPGGGTGVPVNDECANATPVINGVNGPFTSVGAFSSSPAWPCGLSGADVWFRYSVGGSGTLQVDLCNQATWDTTLQIFSGTCGNLVSLGCNDDFCSLRSSLSVPVTTGIYYIRVGGHNSATGAFSLNVNGPSGTTLASTTPYGTGCYRTSKAFYEHFASSQAFDLAGSAMRLVRNGDYYVVQSGGTYVPPVPGFSTLALGDDTFVTVNLSASFPYPGGTTNTLQVCSNGFVSAAPGNSNSSLPTAAAWLSSAQPRWGSWHDYNPAAPGSGGVKYQRIGSIAYVTWDGVYSYGSTAPSTWQLQFDLVTGDVTYAWQSMDNVSGPHLVGYAHTAPNDDLGSMDLSSTLPGGFRTGAYNLQPLTLMSTQPRLGTSLVFTATEYPPLSVLGIQAISFLRHDPGLSLAGFGLAGCFQYCGTEVLSAVFPVGRQSTFATTIPANNAFLGLQINGQTWALSPGANDLGMIASNGVATVLGL
jgi:hypothetical protein